MFPLVSFKASGYLKTVYQLNDVKKLSVVNWRTFGRAKCGYLRMHNIWILKCPDW